MAGPKAVTQYEEVRTKLEEGLSVGDAIKAVAEKLGVSPGTVHTNYYRVTRERGEGRSSPDGRTVTTRAGERTSEDLLRQAVDALTQLVHRAEAQEKDLERLRRIERALTDT